MEKIEEIGVKAIDNGVYVELYITDDGLRWALHIFGDRISETPLEPKLYKSPEMVIGLAIERGYYTILEDLKPQKLITQRIIRSVMSRLDISFDEAREMLGIEG